MFFLILLAVLCISSGAFAGPGQQRFTDIVHTVLKENDPLFLEKVEANLSTLKYTLYNTTIEGYKNCEVNNFEVNEDETASQIELHCPTLTMIGTYDINGRLIVINVEGHGDYSIITGIYKLTINHDLLKKQGKDGKTYLAIKHFETKSELLSPNKFEFKNLFNGQKDLSDAVHNFAHANWKEVNSFLEVPVWIAVTRKIVSNMNEYLKDFSIENIIFR